MKRFKVFLVSFIGFLLMVSPLASMTAKSLNVSPTAVGVVLIIGTILAVSLSPKNSIPGVFMAGVEKENWVDYIVERFWKDNQFLKFFFNESKKVLAGVVVHIPQKGAKPVTVKNREEFPAVAVRSTASDVVYALDEYSVDPTHVHELDKIVLSFDALDEAYGDQIGSVSETIADDMIIKILTGIAAPNILRTSGANVDSTLPGTTGQRKAMVHKDMKRVQTLMNTQGVPKTDRYCLLEENMHSEFTDSLSDTQEKDFSKYFDAATGVVGRLYGFNIMTRASVASATNTDVIRALGAANVATDNAVSVFWQKNCVAFALGDIKVFDDTDNPLYFGDIISSAQRAGGRRRRADNKGVVALIQAAAA